MQYISNCIRSTKFYYKHNAYVTTNITINILVSIQTKEDVTNTKLYKKYFTIHTPSNILKFYVYFNVSNIGSHNI